MRLTLEQGPIYAMIGHVSARDTTDKLLWPKPEVKSGMGYSRVHQERILLSTP